MKCNESFQKLTDLQKKIDAAGDDDSLLATTWERGKQPVLYRSGAA